MEVPRRMNAVEVKNDDSGMWKPLIKQSTGVSLLNHQKFMISTENNDEITCPFVDSFGKTSFSGKLLTKQIFQV